MKGGAINCIAGSDFRKELTFTKRFENYDFTKNYFRGRLPVSCCYGEPVLGSRTLLVDFAGDHQKTLSA